MRTEQRIRKTWQGTQGHLAIALKLPVKKAEFPQASITLREEENIIWFLVGGWGFIIVISGVRPKL